MQALYTSTALALILAVGTAAQAADSKSQAQSGAQQTAQSQQQQPKQQQTQQQSGQQQAAQTQQGQPQAQQGREQQTQALRSIDTNNDGQISAEEAQAHRERAFSALDANSDNKLSREETGGLTAVESGYVVVTRMIPVVMAADIGGQMLSEMDQDQQISRKEYMQYGEEQFKKAQEQAGGQLTTTPQSGQAQHGQQGQTPEWQQVVRWREADVDRNGDGIISADEAASAWVDTFQRLDQNGDDQLSQDELKRMQAQKAMIDQRFAKLDTNGDGQIGLDEYTTAGHDLMQLADLDQDGNVSAWEYRAVRVTDR